MALKNLYPFIGAAAGVASGAGLGGALLGGSLGLALGRKIPKPQTIDVPDISAELAKLTELFSTQRTQAKAEFAQVLGDVQAGTRSRQASMGTFDSPVSEYALGRNVQTTSSALAQMLAGISGQEAQTRAGLIAQTQQANIQAQGFNIQQQSAYEQQKQTALNQIISLTAAMGYEKLDRDERLLDAENGEPKTAGVDEELYARPLRRRRYGYNRF